MKKMLRSALALALSGCLMSSSVLAAATAFTDVPTGHWSYTFVTKAAKEGLVSGMGDGRFGVDDKLSNAQFITMVCNLFYKNDVMDYYNTYHPVDWWRSYMAVAYTKRLLTNTTVAENRQTTNTWSAASVNAEISRYDMAQVMVNVAQEQGWPSVSGLDLLAAQNKIADWNKVPAKYQTAVATAYAKGYLSGMDAAGTFQGDTSMTRAHGAVVVCKLMDSKNNVNVPIYTNTTKLVNGKEPTEENVVSAVAALAREYPSSYVWNVMGSYKSPVLGTSSGSEGFAMMLCDRVFGNFSFNSSKPEDLKPGDIVHLNAERVYAVVEDVYGDTFTYVCSDSNGKITWGNEGSINDLTTWDTIYTRYEGTGEYSSSSDKTLANGSEATEQNAAQIMSNFKRRQYGQGDYWDMDDPYKSTAFYNRNVQGSRAFAYYLSDQIFGELEVNEVTVAAAKDIRVGDVICFYNRLSDDEYAVVVDVTGTRITYVTVDQWGEVTWDNTMTVGSLGTSDTVYTRYPDVTRTLINGKEATEANVKSMLTNLARTYSEGDTWTTSRQTTTLFGRCYGDQAFAGVISDKVFGELKEDVHSDSGKLKAGDVVYLYDEDEYLVVTSVGPSKFSYACVDERGKITWKGEMRISGLDIYDDIYTRY